MDREEFLAGVRHGLAAYGPETKKVDTDPDPSPKPGATRLRHYWTRNPKGLARWDPSRPGRYKRLVRELRKYVGSGAEGLAAVYYKEVMGYWPGSKRHKKKSVDPATIEQVFTDLNELEDKEPTMPDNSDELARLAAHEKTAEVLDADDAWDEGVELDDDVEWEADTTGQLQPRTGDATDNSNDDEDDEDDEDGGQSDTGPSIFDLDDEDDDEREKSLPSLFDTDDEPEVKRQVSQGKRDDLAKQGKAMPDGSYPIETVGDLSNAISAYGRANESKRAELRRFIVRRAKSLKSTHLLPESWSETPNNAKTSSGKKAAVDDGDTLETSDADHNPFTKALAEAYDESDDLVLTDLDQPEPGPDTESSTELSDLAAQMRGLQNTPRR